jgi:hypothetical protein
MRAIVTADYGYLSTATQRDRPMSAVQKKDRERGDMHDDRAS